MDPFEAEAVRLALSKMFRPGGYFDICTLRTCLKVARIDPPKREMDALHALHCISWSDVTPAMRNETVRRTLALFEGAPFDVVELETSLFPEARAVETPRRLFGLLGPKAEA